jgi:ABC-2 type transport system ATP-binding protein
MVISATNVTKSFEGVAVLEGLDLTAENASIYGLVGRNGAGKTTFLRAASGVLRVDSGQIAIDGADVYENESVKRKLFFIPDEQYFLTQASLDRMASFYRGYYPDWDNGVYRKLTALFDLDCKKRLSGFSKGMRRQAAIILALSTRPSCLLLDESFDGLDPVMRGLLKKLLLEYIAEKETSVVISSHNLRELEDLCDHIGLINNKKVVFESNVDDMRKSRSKYRIAFSGDIKEEALCEIPHKAYKQEGHIVTFIAESSPETEQKLRTLNPVLVESLPMTLEEIFMDEMEVRDYDVANIF